MFSCSTLSICNYFELFIGQLLKFYYIPLVEACFLILHHSRSLK